MGRRRRYRAKKKVYCFIVEGCTEENYIRLLRLLYRKGGKSKNCHGGSARGVLQSAEKLVAKHGDDYAGYVVWFDNDRYCPAEDEPLKTSLEASKDVQVEVYISEPCVENWLLAHFQKTKPQHESCNACEQELKKYIPRYKKNDCQLLQKYLDQETIQVAIANYPEIGEIPKKYFIES